MRVLHVIPSISPSSGGTSFALLETVRALHEAGVMVDVATTDDDGAGLRLADIPHGIAISLPTHRLYYFAKQTEFYKVSMPLGSWALRHVTDYDLVHVHALFSFSSLAAASAAWLRGVPYIIAPHGMLNRYGMTQRRSGVKAWSFRLMERPLANRAAALHFTAEMEREESAPLHLKAPARVIPLGIDMESWENNPGPDEFWTRFPQTRRQPMILFLSRLDPKKGVELLLEAFAKAPRVASTSQLVVAGAGAPDYEAELRAKAKELGIEKQVVWTGHLEGSLKRSAFAAADVFALPSHSENFGIALLEAMACGLPCLSGDQVALAREPRVAEIVRVEPRDVNRWSRALAELMGHAEQRRALGRAAAQVARRHYSYQAVGTALRDLYAECLNRKAAGLTA